MKLNTHTLEPLKMLSAKKTESDKPKNRVIQGFYEILHGNSKLLKHVINDADFKYDHKNLKLNEKPGNSVLRWNFKTFT
jgi:hypothetical protein